MKSFEYHAATSVEEAIALLSDPGTRARPLAGGTDLLVQLRQGFREADLLVDVKRIPDLTRIDHSPTDGLTVGAAVTCAQLCERADVQAAYPGLIDAASIIGGAAIQGRATLGGNLCNAAPSGDTIPAMIVLGATCMIAGPDGRRSVPVRRVCTGPGQTVLEPGEIVISIHFPAPAPRSGARYLRSIPRGEMDIAVAGAGTWVRLNDDGSKIVDARIALAAVAPTPVLVDAAAQTLIGQMPGPDAYRRAAEVAQEAAHPITDVRGTRAQRRHLVGVLVVRALDGAVLRARREKVEGEGSYG